MIVRNGAMLVRQTEGKVRLLRFLPDGRRVVVVAEQSEGQSNRVADSDEVGFGRAERSKQVAHSLGGAFPAAVGDPSLRHAPESSRRRQLRCGPAARHNGVAEEVENDLLNLSAPREHPICPRSAGARTGRCARSMISA